MKDMGKQQSKIQAQREDTQGFAVTMPDYASPSFCTFAKEYVGTLAMLKGYIDARKEWEPDSYVTANLCTAVSELQQGRQNTAVGIAGNVLPFVTPVTILAVKELIIMPFQIDHLNVWDCVYHIHAEKCTAKLAYIKAPGVYRRCVLVDFLNPTYDEHLLNAGFWGQPAMLAYESGHLYNRLMYIEKWFSTETEMLMDAKYPAKVDFSGFFDDVFGDG